LKIPEIQQCCNSIVAQSAHKTQFSYPKTTKINSYSFRLVHSPFTIFRTMFQRNSLTEHHTNLNETV